jgi:hypothetical protein
MMGKNNGLYCDICGRRLHRYVTWYTRPDNDYLKDCWGWVEGHYGCLTRMEKKAGIIYGKKEKLIQKGYKHRKVGSF